MIVRILGEGQYDVDDAHAAILNALDSGLEQAVDGGDEAAFKAALGELLAKVRVVGTKLPDDSLEASDALLPDEGSGIEDVRLILADSDEGLIPG